MQERINKMRNLLETHIQKESSMKYEIKHPKKPAKDCENTMQAFTTREREQSIQKSSSKSFLPENNNKQNNVTEGEYFDKMSENYHFFQTHEIEIKEHRKSKVDKVFKKHIDNIVNIAKQCNNN